MERTGPHIIHKVHLHSAIEVHNTTDGTTFQVNDHRLKPYRESLSPEVEKILSERSCLSRLISISARDPFLYCSFYVFLFYFSILGNDG